MNPPSDRDADLDLETLKRLLLTPALRTLHVCNLYFRHGLTAREIAAKVGLSEGAVRQVILRARRKLAAGSHSTPSYRFDVFPQNHC
jgi:DNA-directed RNA polymerase specialized sigma24 family protein